MMASLPMRTSSLLASTSREGTRYFSMHDSRMLIRRLGRGEGWRGRDREREGWRERVTKRIRERERSSTQLSRVTENTNRVLHCTVRLCNVRVPGRSSVRMQVAVCGQRGEHLDGEKTEKNVKVNLTN